MSILKDQLDSYAKPEIAVDIRSQVPVYKQIIAAVENLIDKNIYKEGDSIASMNELAGELDISKETVKKAYTILRERGTLESVQGKGFYINSKRITKVKILLLFDKLSTYKQILYNSFVENAPASAEITIRLHNQDPVLFEQFIDEYKDKYDYYIITPHFSLQKDIQRNVIQTLKKIPNAKLLLLDRNIEGLKGNFGCIYQDFEHDVYDALIQGLDRIREFERLNVLTLPGSLYASVTLKGIKRFCADYKINLDVSTSIKSNNIEKHHAFLILNGQIDTELISLIRLAKIKGFKIGQDIGIIAYNESPINEIILDGLSVLSTDYKQMGELAAKMISIKSFKKIKCNFRLIRRSTF